MILTKRITQLKETIPNWIVVLTEEEEEEENIPYTHD